MFPWRTFFQSIHGIPVTKVIKVSWRFTMCVGSLYCVFLIARKPRIYATAASAYHFFKSHQRYVKLAKVIMCMLLHNQTSTKNFSAVLFSNQSIKELNNTKSNYTLQYITLHYIRRWSRAHLFPFHSFFTFNYAFSL